jgi:glycosyltransferase involved in cell wall biosynthesis
MSAPTVSVCVPNLNTRPFLPERFEGILAQTFGDFELLVYDSHSDDGAWEYICELATRDSRIRAWQGPREGTPGSWTPCVRAARGEYVYIATSDDTMAPDCLEKMVGALETHPECDVAHCCLRPIDEHGRDLPGVSDWWQQGSTFAVSSGPLLHARHIRRAPFDGVLHLLGGSVYISITQLLIRRSLFDRIGYFERTWGSVGDFNWSMRAGLTANTVHVPDTWGGWRVHPTQATAAVTFGSAEHARKIDDMIDNALAACERWLPDQLRLCVSELEERSRGWRAFTREVDARSRAPLLQRRAFLLSRLLAGSQPAREHVKQRLLRGSSADWVRRRLDQTPHTPFLIPVRPGPIIHGGSHLTH